MTKEQAKQKIAHFMGNNKVLTFSIKYFPGPEHKWIAQCNEIDGIITGGSGFDLEKMENLMEDAILTAAGIPLEVAEGLLKRVWGGDMITQIRAEINTGSSIKLFQSTYQLNQYARVG